jgi:hypothetical protein
VCYRGFVFYLCNLSTGTLHDFHIRWCSCRLTVTQRVSRVEQQELLSLPEHMSLPPVVSGVRVVISLVFCVMFYRLLSVLFLLAIVLCVLQRLTSLDYPCSIFKLFLNWNDTVSSHVTGLCNNSYPIYIIIYLCNRTFVFSFDRCIWRAKVHIVLSVLLRFTASNNPFSIFSLFLNWNDTRYKSLAFVRILT